MLNMGGIDVQSDFQFQLVTIKEELREEMFFKGE